MVLMPIQLRYRDSFLAMYVFPLAGSPTMQMRCFTSMGPFLATDDLHLRRSPPERYSAPDDASPLSDPLLEAVSEAAPPVPLLWRCPLGDLSSESDRLKEGVEASEAILAFVSRRWLQAGKGCLVLLLRFGIRERVCN